MKEPVRTILRDAYPEIFFFIDAGECGLGYSPRFRRFSLKVRRGSFAIQTLHFCPFSGRALPEPLGDRFFKEIEALGFMEGLEDLKRVPKEFKSEAWWITRGL